MRGDPQLEGRRVSTLKIVRLGSNVFAYSDGSLMWLLSRFAADNEQTPEPRESVGRRCVAALRVEHRRGAHEPSLTYSV